MIVSGRCKVNDAPCEQDTPRTLVERAYVVENRRVVLDGTGQELLNDPR
jgi:hypothetical protein